jgi:putative hydrolase of HD superfamily
VQQVINFVLELDKLKSVTRKVHPRGLARYENTAEHSWQITLLAISLVAYANEPVNIDHVIRMLLVHDVGEIDAGDTIVFAEHGWAEQKAAERRSVERIFGLLPDDAGTPLLALWQEFEESRTAEARFAHAIDRAMPVLLNLANDGGSWRENGIRYERVVARIAPEIGDGCPALWRYLDDQLHEARRAGWFGMEVPSQEPSAPAASV